MSRIDELKKIDIVSWLVSQGHEIKKETNTKVWFNSPIHMENNPSFVVFKSDGKFKDYGTNLPKGDILDLIQEIEHCNLSTAMDILSDNKDVSKYEPIDVSNEPLITVSHVYDSFISPDLIVYIKSRCIPKNVYSRFVKECHYWFKDSPDKTYRSVGFQNDSSGWELRNGIGHKYATSPKDSTTFLVGSSSCAILEGMFDFLSAVAYFGESFFENDIYVANGLGMLYRNLDRISRYKTVNIYLDRGIGADNSIDLIRSRMYDGVVIDHRYMFDDDVKDFNEFWCNLNK